MVKRILPYALASALTLSSLGLAGKEAEEKVCNPVPNVMSVYGHKALENLLPDVEKLVGKDLPDEKVGTFTLNLPGFFPYSAERLEGAAKEGKYALLTVGLAPDGMQRFIGPQGWVNTTGENILVYKVPVKELSPEFLSDFCAYATEPADTPFQNQLEQYITLLTNELRALQSKQEEGLNNLSNLILSIDKKTGDVLALVQNVSLRVGSLEDLLTTTQEKLEEYAQTTAQQISQIYTRLEEQQNELTALREGQEVIYTEIVRVGEGVKQANETLKSLQNPFTVEGNLLFGFGGDSVNDRTGWNLGGTLILAPGTLGVYASANHTRIQPGGEWNQQGAYTTLSAGGVWRDKDFAIGAGVTYLMGNESLKEQIGGTLVEGRGTMNGFGLNARVSLEPLEFTLTYVPSATTTSETFVNGERVDSATGTASYLELSGAATFPLAKNVSGGVKAMYTSITTAGHTQVTQLALGPVIKFK